MLGITMTNSQYFEVLYLRIKSFLCWDDSYLIQYYVDNAWPIPARKKAYRICKTIIMREKGQVIMGIDHKPVTFFNPQNKI